MSESSQVKLREVATGELVDAEMLIPITDQQIVDWQRLWKPERDRRIDDLKQAGVSIAKWPESWHWDWEGKLNVIQGMISHTSVAITCKNETQGLMRLDLTSKRGRHDSQLNSDLAYIDYLEVAPWNWKDKRFPLPKYDFIGSLMVQAAIEISFDQGFKGRVGLHSLPQSVSFYAKHGFEKLGADPACQDLPYFELTAESAAKKKL